LLPVPEGGLEVDEVGRTGAETSLSLVVDVGGLVGETVRVVVLVCGD